MRSFAETFPNNEELTIEPEIEEVVEEPVEEVVEEIPESEVSGYKFGKVIGGSLNLRSEPSTDSQILKILPIDTQVNYKGKKEEIGEFVKVRVEEFDEDGFVMDKFIEWDED